MLIVILVVVQKLYFSRQDIRREGYNQTMLSSSLAVKLFGVQSKT